MTNIFTILKAWWKEYNEITNELSAMGFFDHPYGSFFSGEMYEAYMQKVKDQDKQTTK